MESDESGQVDVGELIDRSPLAANRLNVVVLCALVVLMDGYDIQTMALAVPSLSETWGIEPSAFAFALSASVLGMLFGTAIVGPAGDRLGRRPLLIAGMIIVGLASVATAFSATPAHLVFWRLLTGIGLGMSLPNATALTSEYVPRRIRAFLITAMYISIAVGALGAGFLAPALIGAFGWRSIFIVGGVLPLIVSVLLVAYVPESVRLLCAKRPQDPRIADIVRRFFPDVNRAAAFVVARGADVRQSVLALFTPEYRGRTVLLWCVFALNLFVLFVLISWLPTILSEAGWTRAQALRGAVVIQAGGIVGGLVISRLVDVGRAIASLAGAFAIVAVALVMFLFIPSTLVNWTVLLLLVGAGVSGSQGALTALSAIFYRPAIRATGAGWASACGRAGAVLAPLAGGLVLQRFTLQSAEYLALLIPPTLLCVLCVLLLSRVWHQEPVLEVGTEIRG